MLKQGGGQQSTGRPVLEIVGYGFTLGKRNVVGLNTDEYKTQVHVSRIFSPFFLQKINFLGINCFLLFHSNIANPGPTSSVACGTSLCQRRKVGD